ncbi:MAG: ribosome maturation factor RimM [bacterium]|jgi:16S rRNA processing protein RimM
MGRVAGAYGVRGWVRVLVDDPEDLSGQPQWWVGGVERAVEQAKPHSGALLAKLQGIDDRGQAQALNGAAVELPRKLLPAPEPGRYYWADLIGLEVVNESGVVLGRVKALFSNGAHDVMELDARDGGTGRLLPWVASVVNAVDLERGCIEVQWGADW